MNWSKCKLSIGHYYLITTRISNCDFHVVFRMYDCPISLRPYMLGNRFALSTLFFHNYNKYYYGVDQKFYLQNPRLLEGYSINSYLLDGYKLAPEKIIIANYEQLP